MCGKRNEVLLSVGLIFPPTDNAFRCDAMMSSRGVGLENGLRQINPLSNHALPASVIYVPSSELLFSSHWWSWTPVKLLLGLITMELSIAHRLGIPRTSLG